MLSSIIKVKLEKNCCPFEKLENRPYPEKVERKLRRFCHENKLCRNAIINSRMPTLFVIKDFYVFKYGSSGLLSEKYQ